MNQEFEGTRWVYGISSYSQNEWHYVGSGANDEASSLGNNRVHSTYYSENYPPGSGGQRCESPDTWDYHLQNVTWPQNGHNMNDSISGFSLLSYVACEEGF